MNLFAVKIYNDGSHWIAIPHTERPYRKQRRKKPEKSEELQQFEQRFEKVKGKRKNRKAKLLQEFTPMFRDEDEAVQFVEQHFERLSRNRWERYKRMIRRGYTNRWNFFCTYTFDSRKHTEESFKRVLKICLRNFSNRSKWKYIGVWERSPQKQRLHFHGIFYIPAGTMPGMMLYISDYNFKSQRRRITHQNTYFNERFGRSDFEEIEGRSVGGAVAYIMKYIEKSGEKLLYSRGLPQYFISDIMEEDVVCPYGEEEQKLLLYDDFSCWDEGEYMGQVCDDVIDRLPKAN